ncbi:MAG: hypothetical protein JST80_10855 [Bdellovibrionales bacterium]|nr:hypothetical protein [Bdellovibrionales bacterium]
MHLDHDGALLLTLEKPTKRNGAIAYFDLFSTPVNKETMTYSSDQKGRCILCHSTGVMPVAANTEAPVYSFGSKPSSEVLNWFNNDLAARYPDAKLKGFDSGNLGLPQIGELNPSHRDESFIRECATSSKITLTGNSIQRVKSAMNCAACHDGRGVGIVNTFLAPQGGVYEQMIDAGVMPPESDLNQDEKAVLKTCLNAEYFGGFTKKDSSGILRTGTLQKFIQGFKEN